MAVAGAPGQGGAYVAIMDKFGLTPRRSREEAQGGCAGQRPIAREWANAGAGEPPAPAHSDYIPSTLFETSTLTATRRFCALPSGVLLSASGSAVAIPVGVSIRHGFQPQACWR